LQSLQKITKKTTGTLVRKTAVLPISVSTD